jgi:hypothetical protein
VLFCFVFGFGLFLVSFWFCFVFGFVLFLVLFCFLTFLSQITTKKKKESKQLKTPSPSPSDKMYRAHRYGTLAIPFAVQAAPSILCENKKNLLGQSSTAPFFHFL